jgi:hypothetical protein
MGRLPDNYLGPKQRVTMLKKEYPADTSAVLTEATHIPMGEALCILIKASISMKGTVVATGHAFTDCPEDDKAVEKAETIAIGRALVNAGYPETLDVEEEEKEYNKPVKSSGLGNKSGLGAAKKQEKKEDVEETESDDGEDSDEAEEAPKPKSSGGLGKLGSKPSSSAGSSKASSNSLGSKTASPVRGEEPADAEEESDEEEDETFGKPSAIEDDEDSEGEQESTETPKEAPKKQLTKEELLAKYRNKK